MKVLSVVCARAGSKSLKNKCITKINNKMVIEYAIEYSLSLGNSVKTVVSTDIKEVLDYCIKNNISYIKREQKMCTDECRIDDALADAIEKEGKGFQYCSLVYGNIPTRYPEIFHEWIRHLELNTEYDATISMQNVEKFHPDWMFDYNNEVIPRKKETHYRRQGLSQKMIHDGHTLIFNIDKFYKKYKDQIAYDKSYRYSIYGDKIKPLINDKAIVDIDTKKDLKFAESIIMLRSTKGS